MDSRNRKITKEIAVFLAACAPVFNRKIFRPGRGNLTTDDRKKEDDFVIFLNGVRINRW